MWVILRLLGMVVVGLTKLLRRQSRYEERRGSGRGAWVFRHGRHKSKTVSTTFGVPFVHPVFFKLTRESGVDRFFRAIGWSHEFQSGDQIFDDAVYVACDHPALLPVLQADTTARAAVQRLFDRDVKYIYTDGAHLWAHRRGDSLPGDESVGNLIAIRDALEGVPKVHLRGLRDSFFWKAMAIEAVAWSIALYGVPAILEIALRSHPQYSDWTPIITMGLTLSVAVFAALLGLAWIVLRGSTRTHRIFAESALLLAIGVPCSSVEIVSDTNVHLDHSPPSIVEPVVQSKYTRITTGRRGRRRTHYHLVVRPPSSSPLPIANDIEVSADIYNAARIEGILRVTLRSGALKVPWVEDIRAEP